MVAKFKPKAEPFPHARPQRPHSRDLHLCLLSHLLHPSHQVSCSSTLPSGLKFLSPLPTNALNLYFLIVLFLTLQLDGSVFVNVEVGQSLEIEDPDGRFTVTAFGANHCPGKTIL